MRWVYNIYYVLLFPIFKLLYGIRTIGRENIPEGPAMICANHSSFSDPIIAAFALTRKHYVHFMAKKELGKIPGLKFIIYKAGSFFVNRGASDVTAIKTAMKYLKAGEKVLIFPEGTRVMDDISDKAKSGAVRIAAKTGAPVLPMYIPRKKKLFTWVTVAIGEPFHIPEPPKDADTSKYYKDAAADLMEHINSLKDDFA